MSFAVKLKSKTNLGTQIKAEQFVFAGKSC